MDKIFNRYKLNLSIVTIIGCSRSFGVHLNQIEVVLKKGRSKVTRFSDNDRRITAQIYRPHVDENVDKELLRRTNLNQTVEDLTIGQVTYET